MAENESFNTFGLLFIVTTAHLSIQSPKRDKQSTFIQSQQHVTRAGRLQS